MVSGRPGHDVIVCYDTDYRFRVGNNDEINAWLRQPFCHFANGKIGFNNDEPLARL